MDVVPDERPRSRTVRRAAMVVVALMLWSVVGNARVSVGQEAPIEEPSDVSAYATTADAMPIQLWFDHQTRLVPLGPAIAHAQSEVALPSQAKGNAWLVDGGVANGLHGTSTGNRVPTEAAAQQPGGEPEEEFVVAGGPIGHPSFMTVRAGRAYARAERSDTPEGYGNSFIKNIAVLPAAGAVDDDPPGTYDPQGRAPNQDGTGVDPQPKGQMAIVSIGSIASTARSLREESRVTSIAVAELKDVNIGNRTSDNRCTNCIRFDSIRAEAYAEANGKPGGAKASYRVLLGRACRRSFDAESGKEQDRCLPLDPREPQGTRGLQSVDQLEELNAAFEQPIWTKIPGGAVDYQIGVRIHAGSRHCEPSRAQRTPRDQPCRNQASPETGADGDAPRGSGEVAEAVAEGIDVEIFTITVAQAAGDVAARIAGTPAEAILHAIDEDDAAPGIQLCGPGALCDATGQQSIPLDTVTGVRRLQLTLGVAKASAIARAGAGLATAPDAATGGGDGAGAFFGPPEPPAFGEPPPDVTAPDGAQAGGSGAVVVGGLRGPFRVRLDWSSMRIRPWAPGDMAQAIVVGAMLAGALWLLRRRVLRAGP